MICIRSIPLGHGKHVDRHQQQGLDGPEAGVFESRQRITVALCAPEEKLGLVKLGRTKPLDDTFLGAAGRGCGHDKADGEGEKQEAEEGVVVGGLQRVRVARIEVLSEVFAVKDIDKTAGLLGVSASPALLLEGEVEEQQIH